MANTYERLRQSGVYDSGTNFGRRLLRKPEQIVESSSTDPRERAKAPTPTKLIAEVERRIGALEALADRNIGAVMIVDLMLD